MLSKFKDKLEKVKEKEETSEGNSSKTTNRVKSVNDNNDDDIVGGKWFMIDILRQENLFLFFLDDWLSHTLQFDQGAVAVLAKDASTKQDDWYDVYDPRNPINKRKRGETSTSSHNKKWI